MPKITVLATPDVFFDRDVSGYAAAVIDVLRATSSIACALSSGCANVIPARDKEEALAKKYGLSGAMLAGEEGGLKISGFDLGNSPLEFTPQSVGGKTLVMTTSNGTKAVLAAHVAGASPVFLCSFLNVDAVAKACVAAIGRGPLSRGIAIFCSGSHGEFSLEDFTCAGALAERLVSMGGFVNSFEADSSARAAIYLWRAYGGDAHRVLEDAPHGRQLVELGFDEDIKHCARVGVLDIVPEFRAGTVTVQCASIKA